MTKNNTAQALKMRPDILMINGSYFDFLRPSQSSFTIETIAHGLSNTCRFAGQCREFYSVAQHSVLVSLNVPEQFALQALLHDASEAFIGDISSPLKQLLPDYRKIEKRIEAAIFTRFGLPETMAEPIKVADMLLLTTEQRDLMPDHQDTWLGMADIEPMGMTIKPLTPEKARAQFLDLMSFNISYR